MESSLQRYAPPLARVLLSAIFLMSGVGKVFDWSGTSAYMESQNMPAVPFFLLMAILFEIVGGLMVFAGFRARIGAVLLIVFLIPATLIFHDFWNYPDDQQRMQMINFMKNLSIMGGLLMVLGFGAGSLSLDARRRE